MKTKRSLRGFTLVELLVIVGVIAVVGSAGYVVSTNVQESARQNKLEADVAQVNSALLLYKANGGVIPANATEAQVLAKLKSRAQDETALKSIGLKGSFLDTRVKVDDKDWQSLEEGSSSQVRAYWDNDKGRFVIGSSGPAGIKKFSLSDAEAAAGPAQDSDARVNNLQAAVQEKWVWDFEDKALAATDPLSAPSEGTIGNFTPGTASSRSPLQPPQLPPDGNFNLGTFDMNIRIDNPNAEGLSLVYYRTGTSPGTGTYQIYRNEFSVPPNTYVDAYAYSIDPDRWDNSSVASGNYAPIDTGLQPDVAAGAVTYASAGGLMANGSQAATPVSASLTLPAPANVGNFFSSSYIDVTYSVAGVSQSAPAFSGNFTPISVPLGPPGIWTSSSFNVSITAAPKAGYESYFDAGSDSVSVSISQLPMALTFSPGTSTSMAATDKITISPANSANFPATYSIYYTIDGTEPDRTKTLYPTGGFSLGSGATNIMVRAKAFPTSVSDEKWFNMITGTGGPYTVPVASSALPSGVLVSLAELQNNVQLNGSMTLAWTGTASNITFFGNSKVNGNVYVPGTPSVYKDHIAESQWDFQKWTGTTDGNFANYILGKQYDGNGNLVIPQTQPVSPRVVDLDGDPNPSNYTILIQDSAKIDGKLYRRSTKIALPTVAQPPSKTNSNTRQYNSWTLSSSNPGAYPPVVDPTVNSGISLTHSATLTLMPGNYGNVTASNAGKMVLGDAANPNNTQYYTFESLQLSGGAAIDIVGKVVITINHTAGGQTTRIDNSSYIGNSAHPEYLQLDIYSNAAPNANNQHFLVASNGRFYGRVNAPKGLVTIQEGAIFSGAVTAYKLQMTGSAGVNINFNLAPVSG